MADERKNDSKNAAPGSGGVLVTGATGFIGPVLVSRLMSLGFQVSVLTRDVSKAQKILPDGVTAVTRLKELSPSAVSAGIINLAGANLADKRWTPAYKSQILASRINLTQRLVEWCAQLASKPPCLISASAIGFYGDRGDEVLTEDSAGGLGFGHALCRDWEQMALTAEQHGIRVCLARLGVVMDADGGAFSQMVMPYRFRVGVTLGGGQNWLSWIYRADAVSALCHLLMQPDCSGAYNLVAPEPIKVAQFSEALRQYWPVWMKLSAPAFLLKLGLGEFAPEVLLASQRVIPERLQAADFEFVMPSLDLLLQQMVNS